MDLRDYLQALDQRGDLFRVREPVSKEYEIAGILKKLEPRPVLFEQVLETDFPLAGNLFCDKAAFGAYFGVPAGEVIPMLRQAIGDRSPCPVVEQAACQEVVVEQPDLDRLPLLMHCAGDGGNYISSGVVIARHPRHGQNLDFHRCMQFSKTEMLRCHGARVLGCFRNLGTPAPSEPGAP